MSTKSRRFLSFVPRLVGRVWNDITPSLQDYLERLRDAVTNGIPGGVTDTTPSQIAPDNTADLGTENAGWSPGDHTHDVAVDAPVALGAALAEGTANSLSRSDHVHPRAIEALENGAGGGIRRRLNFIDTASIVWTLTEDIGGDEIEVEADAADTWREVVAFPLITPPNAEDDEFRDGSINADFDQMDGSGTGATTWIEDGDIIGVAIPAGDAGGELHGQLKDIAGIGVGDYVEVAVRIGGNAGGDITAGLCFNDNDHVWGSSGVQAVGLFGWNRTANSMDFWLGEWNGLATIPGSISTAGATVVQTPWIYLRLVYEAANSFRLDWSVDGVNWVNSIPATAITLTPTGAGMVCGSPGNANPGGILASWEYFRVVT